MCVENGHCIDKRKVCDFKIDCPTPGGSDEAQCGTCTFDNNNGTLCSWEDHSFSDLNWILATGATNMGPSSDHTTGNGFYITVPPNNFYKFASLRSPTVGPAGIECQLKFSYYMNTQTAMNSSRISVYIRNENDNFTSFTYIANIDHSTGPEWKQNVINIGYQSRRFFIEIDGIPYEKTAIGIDDVEFYNCQSETAPELGLSINCTFENGWCNFFQDTTADFQWTRTNIQTSSANAGPDFDHTSGSGYYVFLEASSPRIPGDHARLISALQYPSSTPQCLTFWYHMYGSDIGTLNVFVQMISTDLNSTSSTLVWTKSGAHGNQWHRATHTLDNLNSTGMYGWRIAFDGVVGGGFLGDIALDDIGWSPNTICSAEKITTTLSQPVASTTYPPTIYDCNFECNCTCNWKNDNTTNFTWAVTQAMIWSSGIVDDSDHTTGATFGYYMYFKTNPSAKFNDTTRLISPDLISTNDEKCFRFYYRMYGSNIYQLNIYARINGNLGKALWRREGNQGNQWLFGSLSLGGNHQQTIGQPYQLVVENLIGKNFLGYISVDDLAVNSGPCPISSVCDFESSEQCDYINDPTNTINWKRSQAETDSSFPSIDVTYSTSYGHFMLLKDKNTTGPVYSRLITPHYPSTSGSCLRWYMLLENAPTLNIKIDAVNILNSTNLYTIHGTYGKQWRLAQTTIRSTSSYQVIFEGILNNANKIIDSLAIDDIEMKSGVCEELGSCDFENGLCGFQNIRSDFSWKRTSHSTEVLNTLEVDHTTNSERGFYLWIDREQSVKGQKARIESEIMPIGIRCISFWSYLNNTLSAELNVYIHDLQLDIYSLIWSTNKPRGPFWVYREINTPPILTVNRTTGYTIVYEAIVGSNTGDFAIDDLLTQPGACTQTTTAGPTTPYTGPSTTRYAGPSTTTTGPTTPYTGPSTTRYTGTSTTTTRPTTPYTGPATTRYTGTSRTPTPPPSPETPSTTTTGPTTPYTGPSTTRYTGTSTTTAGPTTPYAGPSTTRSTNPSITGDTHPLTSTTVVGSESIGLLISSYSEESTLQTGSLMASDSYSSTLPVISETTAPDSINVTSNSYIVCATYVCFNGGSCKQEVGAAICECTSDYNGPQCENKKQPSKKSNLAAILGGVFGALGGIGIAISVFAFLSSKLGAARVAVASTPLVDSSTKVSSANPVYSEADVNDV
ncbi:unnamed protein product [Rotaria socialis]|uniref:Uncharacterized protein n=5 Tax=Rotaria socialis TaxID=392032 RepID=A0A818C472_9BILA|nr:unnamed protein product [Rotaria socialis]